MTPFWRFWAATAVTKVGTSVTTVALPTAALMLLAATPTEVGLVVGMTYVGWAVFGLPAGAICQRLPLRGVQVTTDLIRAALLLSIPVAWAFDALSVLQLAAVAAAVSVCNVLFDVSNSTFLPAIVPEEELQSRNSWLSGLGATTDTIGPSAAGALIQVVGPAAALVVDVVSYLGSALLLRTLPPRTQPQAPVRAPLGTMIREGWQYVTRHPVMRACLLDATASNFVAGGLLVLLPVIVLQDGRGGPFALGLLFGAEGVGGLIGAVAASRLARSGTARSALYGSILSCLLLLLIPWGLAGPGLVLAMAGSVGYAAGQTVTSVNTRTFRQLESPPELLSRVMATVRFVSWGVVPFGSLVAGVLATRIGSVQALVVYCLLGWLSPLALLVSPARSLRDLRDWKPELVGHS